LKVVNDSAERAAAGSTDFSENVTREMNPAEAI